MWLVPLKPGSWVPPHHPVPLDFSSQSFSQIPLFLPTSSKPNWLLPSASSPQPQLCTEEIKITYDNLGNTLKTISYFYWTNRLSDSLFHVNNIFWLPSPFLSFPQPCQQLSRLPQHWSLCHVYLFLFCFVTTLSLSRVICVTMGLVIPNQASGLTIPYTLNIMTLPPSVSSESSTSQELAGRERTPWTPLSLITGCCWLQSCIALTQTATAEVRLRYESLCQAPETAFSHFCFCFFFHAIPWALEVWYKCLS